jgi:hypothetical protein
MINRYAVHLYVVTFIVSPLVAVLGQLAPSPWSTVALVPLLILIGGTGIVCGVWLALSLAFLVLLAVWSATPFHRR